MILRTDIQNDFDRVVQLYTPRQETLSGGLSEYEVLKAHYIVSDYFISEGDMVLYGVKSFDLLSSAVSRQEVEFGGVQKWQDEYHKMATLLYGITKNHAFEDGNKRTALLSLLLFINKSNLQVAYKQSVIENLIVRIAANTLDEYANYKYYKEKDDPEVNFIADKIKKYTRKTNRRIYTITYAEFDRRLKQDAENTDAIVVEQSEDNKTFVEIQRLAGTATQTTVEGLIADKIYYFRMKAIGKDGEESLYSATVSVNDEYMRPGGGTRAGTNPFVPTEGKLYRIICYATIPYNSGTTYQGTPKYLTFNANGTLGTTEEYQWDNPNLLWKITSVDGGVNIRNYGNNKYIAAANSTISGSDRIGMSDAATVLTINYTGNQQPAQSGLYGDVSMYRINSPSNKNQQIRARGFVDDWIYGNGDIARADMAFTFVEIDASLVSVLKSTIESALTLANSAQTDVTLGYPSEAVNQLMNVIAEAQTFAQNMNEQTPQEEIDAQVEALNNAMATFKTTRIYTFDGFSMDLAYNIYSYGTHPGAKDENASMSTQRRYLYAVKNSNGDNDNLVYRIGLSDNDINSGKKDAYMTDSAALWAFEAADNGYVRARNLMDGQYLQIETQLSVTPVAIHPYYAQQDNGKMAFYMDATEEGKRLFNVGVADADGKGGPLEFFAAHAPRTRLRWVIEETDVEVTFPATGISSVSGAQKKSVRYFTIEGIELKHRPSTGIYLERTTKADGSVTVKKKIP